jgi:general secretion pathway protein D
MLRKIAAGMTVLALVATAAAQASKSPRPTARTGKSDTLRILEQKLPEVQFQETPFEQVVEWLRDFTKLNISVRWQKLADAGIERDKPVTIQVRNLRLSQVLWMIMNELGGSEVKLAYRISGNLLIFSTTEDLDKEMVTKVYDIADLLLRVPRATRSSGFDVSQGLSQGGGQGGQGGGGGGGGGGSGMFGQGQQQQGQQSQYDQRGDQEQTDKLIELIQDTVEPDSWQKHGGTGSIKAYQRTLVVRNTILVHQRLGGYVTEGEVLGR